MPSSTSNFDFQRAVPDLPWRGLVLAVVLLTTVGTVAWERHARSLGYPPALNDTSDLWADQRQAVKPDSIVIVGDSRGLFDNDLDTLQQGLGQRPVQLALVGSCAYPVLENLANDESFHGTVIASMVPLMWFAPPPSPPYHNSTRALKRYAHRTLAQRSGHILSMWLEEHFAFMSEDLKLEQLLDGVPVTPRAAYHPGPLLPPDFSTIDRDRRTRMWENCRVPGPLQERVKHGWLPLFTPPPPPPFVPKEAFAAGVAKAMEARFADTITAVKKIQARGGKIVFVRYPVSGELKKHEDRLTPRVGPWNGLIKATGAPGIYFEDYPELAGFTCPEWSHLSAADSVEFTKLLLPHLQQALAP